MGRRFQIVITPRAGQNADPRRLTRFGRFKSLFAGLVVVTIALAILIAALILGYVIAAVACAVMIIAAAIVVMRSIFSRTRNVE